MVNTITSGASFLGSSLAQYASLPFLNIQDFGAVGNGVADDAAAIQSAFDAASDGDVIWFPRGTYLISVPLNIQKQLHLVGSDEKYTLIKTGASFTGYYLIRNWTDTDSATADPPTSVVTGVYYPHIEHLRITVDGHNNLTLIGWVAMQECGYIRNLIMRSDNATGTRGIRLAALTAQPIVGGNALSNIVCYGSGWGTELYIDPADLGGYGVYVDNWTTASAVHSESVFYAAGKLQNLVLRHMHIEAWTTDVAGAAIVKLNNIKGFVMSESFINYGGVTSMAHPIVRATNTYTDGVGYSVGSPILRDIKINGVNLFTANLIEDHAQAGNSHDITAAGAPACYIVCYDGNTLNYHSGGNAVPTITQIYGT